jgi:predicted  nucleic acid-binding Zn-ribbon protein
MTSENKTLLAKLIDLSKVDVAMARIKAERKTLETELQTLHSAYKKEEQDRAQKQRIFDEKNGRYTKEEKRLRDESDKLVQRRKALTSLNNYKLQQSAEKEIEHASRQITSQEEALLLTLDEVEKLKSAIAVHDESLAKQKTAYNQRITEAKAILANLEERNAEHQKNRQEIALNIDAKNLSVYERCRERFTMDPMVPIVNNLCSGCHMQIGPQVIVLIGKASSLVRCPGCARILYVNEGELTASIVDIESSSDTF